MAALLRGILATNKGLLPSRKLLFTSRKPLLTSSMCTNASKFPRLVKDGWEFCLCDPPEYTSDWLRDLGLRDPMPLRPDNFTQHVLSIKHLDSGIAFRFSTPDALYKRIKEKETRNPLASDLPSYDSPLFSELECLLDSAYVGRVVIEKQSEEPIDSTWKDVDKILDEPINPIWKRVDQETLDEQIAWMTKNQHVSDIPIRYSPFENGKIEAKKSKAKKPKAKKNGMLDPIVNFMFSMYKDMCPGSIGYYTCRAHLVITDFGWFLHLEQPFYGRGVRARRLREMTMHCSFKENTIYREITESQHENFEKRLLEMAVKDIPDAEPLVYYHEVKQLRIEDIRAESESVAVHGAARYRSFTVGEQKKNPMGKPLPVPVSVIESLIASGKPLQHVEEKFGSSILICPLFRHPYNPRATQVRWRYPVETPRKAYVVYSEYTEEYIRSASSNLLNLVSLLEKVFPYIGNIDGATMQNENDRAVDGIS